MRNPQYVKIELEEPKGTILRSGGGVQKFQKNVLIPKKAKMYG